MRGATVIHVYTSQADQKLWMTLEIQRRLKVRDAAFRSEDKVALGSVRSDLPLATRRAMLAHTETNQGQI